MKTPGICAFVLRGPIVPSKEVRQEICEEVNADATEDSDTVAWAQFTSNVDANNRWVDTIPMITGEIDDKAYSRLNKTLGLKQRDLIFVGVQPDIFTVLLDMIVINDRAVQLC